MRPGPRRAWASANPPPRSPSMFSAGTRQLTKRSSQWLAHNRHLTHELIARRVGWDDEHARSTVRRCHRIGDGEDDRERRVAGVGDEPLVTVDDPRVTVLHGRRADLGRVGAGHLRLGHGDARADLVGDERLQIRAFLLRRAGQPQDLGVASVGCGGAEHARSDRAAAQLFIDQAEGDVAHTQTARFGRQVGGP